MRLAFMNGMVRRGNGSPDTDRLHVEDGVIAEWPTVLPAETEVVDLAGGFLGAAFADGHVHPMLDPAASSPNRPTRRSNP